MTSRFSFMFQFEIMLFCFVGVQGRLDDAYKLLAAERAGSAQLRGDVADAEARSAEARRQLQVGCSWHVSYLAPEQNHAIHNKQI